MPEYHSARKKKTKSSKQSVHPDIQPQKRASSSGFTVMQKKKSTGKKKAVKQNQKRNSVKKQTEKRQKQKRNLVIYYVFLVILAGITLSVLSVTVLFNIQEIRVILPEDMTVYTEEQVIEAAAVEPGENLLRFDTEAVRQRIFDHMVRLDAVNVKKGFPNALVIEVQEALPVACIQYGAQYFAVSRSGRILEESKQPGAQILIRGYEPDEPKVGAYLSSVHDRKYDLAFTLIDAIEAQGMTKINEINIEEYLGIELIYDGRMTLKLGTSSDLDLKLSAAKRVIETNLSDTDNGVLRLSNPIKAFFRPSSADEYKPPEDLVVTTEPEETDADDLAEDTQDIQPDV